MSQPTDRDNRLVELLRDRLTEVRCDLMEEGDCDGPLYAAVAHLQMVLEHQARHNGRDAAIVARTLLRSD